MSTKESQEQNEADDALYDMLMDYYTPFKGFMVKEYYGVSVLKIKKNGYYNIKLVYDYGNHPMMSNILEVPDLERMLHVVRVLEERSKDKTDKFALDDMLKKKKKDNPW